MNKRTSKGTKFGSFIGNLFKNNSFEILAFTITALLILFVYFCYNALPFGDKTVLRIDLYHQYGPLFGELHDRLADGGSFLYSWNTGLGSSFLGNFFNYLSSPLSFIVLLLGHFNMPETVSVLILLKGSLASAFFCYYLKRSVGKHDHITAAFGILYSFCGFFIAYYWNIMWIDAMMLFPLVILGIENIINKRKATLYIIVIALVMISNYYMSFMVCMFSIIYFMIYYFSKYNFDDCCGNLKKYAKNDTEYYYKKSDKIKKSRFLTSGLLFAGGSLLAACLAAFALLPVYFILQSSNAISDTLPKEIDSYFTIFDFLANHLASLEPTIRSSGEDVLPNVYCGIVTVMLVPLYLFIKSIPIKEKIANVGLLAFFYFSFNINYANFVWHGFHFPNDLPYRFSFMYSFILLAIAYKAIRHISELKGKDILATGIGIAFFIILVQELGSKNVNEITVVLSLLFVFFYTLLLYALRSKKLKAGTIALLILVCVTGEVISCDSYHFSMSQTKTVYAGDYHDFRKVKNEIDEIENNNFYRMELTELRARMDPSWYNYNGVSHFSSMAYEKVSNLQNNLGMMSNYINSCTYNLQTPVYNAMMSLKYIVKNDENDRMSDNLYKHITTSGVFTAYENKYELPIAFMVDSKIENWSHEGRDPFIIQSDFFEKATGVNDVFKRLEVSSSDISYDNVDTFYTGFESGFFTFNKTVEGAAASFTITITPETTQNCYIYVKGGEVSNVHIEGSDFFIKHENKSNIIDLGLCQADEPIYIELPISDSSDDSGNVTFFAYELDMDKFVEGYNRLEREKFEVETFEDTLIKGTVNAREDGMLYTSIPYDEGWSIKVDGKALNAEDIVKVGNALIGVNLEEGKHDIEFSFMPKGFMLGLYISGSALALLVIILITLGVKNKRTRKKAKIGLGMSPFQNLDDDIDNYEDEIDGERNLGISPLNSVGYNISDFSIDDIGDDSDNNDLSQNTQDEAVDNSDVENNSNDIYVSQAEKAPIKDVIKKFGKYDDEIIVEKFEGKE
ncbi:MAG TPA: YfhO family protein [Clostridia bacterium]|nr:YfhO family protein [Clostridia bacterium]